MLAWAAQVSTLEQASVTAFANSLNLLYQVIAGCSRQHPKPFLTRIDGNDVEAPTMA